MIDRKEREGTQFSNDNLSEIMGILFSERVPINLYVTLKRRAGLRHTPHHDVHTRHCTDHLQVTIPCSHWSPLSLSLHCSLVSSQRTPTISYVTPNISTTRSSTIDMECSVLWATAYPVLWMKIDKDGKPIPLASGSSLIIRDHRFAMRYDTASATYTLQLKDIQRSDEGRYECQIIVQVSLPSPTSTQFSHLSTFRSTTK